MKTLSLPKRSDPSFFWEEKSRTGSISFQRQELLNLSILIINGALMFKPTFDHELANQVLLTKSSKKFIISNHSSLIELIP